MLAAPRRVHKKQRVEQAVDGSGMSTQLSSLDDFVSEDEEDDIVDMPQSML